MRASYCWRREGMQNKEIAALLGVGRVQVARWRERYAERIELAGIERDLPAARRR